MLYSDDIGIEHCSNMNVKHWEIIMLSSFHIDTSVAMPMHSDGFHSPISNTIHARHHAEIQLGHGFLKGASNRKRK